MSSTTSVTDFSDLYTDFLNRVRGNTSNSTTTVLAKRYINTALVDMHLSPAKYKFSWAHKRAVLITHAPYTDGTVTIAAATRTTVTGSSTLWNTVVTGFGFNNARAGGKMKFSGLNEISVVSTVGGDTAITLVNNYTGAALADADYTYYEDEYALASDFLGFLDINFFSTDLNIPLIGAQEFRRRFGRNDISGKPKFATHIQLGFSSTTSPQHRVVLSPYPDDEYQLPYWYITSNLAVTSGGTEQRSLSSNDDEPIVPIQYRGGIVLHALYNYYRDFKDDTRSQESKAEYLDFMRRMMGDFDVGSDKAQFIVRHGVRRYKQRYDYGNRFDTLKDRGDY